MGQDFDLLVWTHLKRLITKIMQTQGLQSSQSNPVKNGGVPSWHLLPLFTVLTTFSHLPHAPAFSFFGCLEHFSTLLLDVLSNSVYLCHEAGELITFSYRPIARWLSRVPHGSGYHIRGHTVHAVHSFGDPKLCEPTDHSQRPGCGSKVRQTTIARQAV